MGSSGLLTGNGRLDWRDYLPELNSDSPLGIRPIAWQQYELLNPSGAVVERSMLVPDEAAFLFAVAKDHYLGEGEIIDLGPLLGVGTNALARGLALNPSVADKSKRIHSFDLFLAKGMGPIAGAPSRAGTVLDRFLRNNHDYLASISVAAGDLLNMSWDRSSVEVLFIDIAKTWQLNDHVVRTFFPCLIPNRSVVIQQDYVHFAEYWVAITMEVFADYFEHIAFVNGATSAYLYTREIPNAVVHQRLEDLPLERKLYYLECAREKAPGTVREVLKCAQAWCLIDTSRYEEAHNLLATVDLGLKGDDPTADFGGTIASNVMAVDNHLRRKLRRTALPIYRGGEGAPQGFRADLHVTLDRTEVSSKETITGVARVTNTGSNRWNLSSAPVGIVNLGTHLRDATTMEIVNYNFSRHGIGSPTLTTLAPGEQTAFVFEIPAPVYGRYVLEFDLVSEQVCWFGDEDSTTVSFPINIT